MKVKQLKKYSCRRMGVLDCIITRKNHIYAAKQLKAAPQNVTSSIEEACELNEDVVYRVTELATLTPQFDYTSTRESRSPNSIHYYTSRGWSIDEANTLISQHRRDHIIK